MNVVSGRQTEITLPITFFESDDAEELIKIIAKRGVGADEKTGTYELTVKRGPRALGTARLESLTTDLHDLMQQPNPEFDPDVFDYTVYVAPDATAITVTAVADKEDNIIVFNNDKTPVYTHTAEQTFTLKPEDKVSYIFITVSGDDDTPATYKIKVERKNNAFLTKLEVTDTDPNDGYEKFLAPNSIFNKDVTNYEVLVDPLASKIEFTMGTDAADATLTMLMNGQVQAQANGENELAHTFTLAYDQKTFNLEFKIEYMEGTTRKSGTYYVTVTRDTELDEPIMQTWIEGYAYTVNKDDHTAKITMYDEDGQVPVNSSGDMVLETPPTGFFSIELPHEGIFRIVMEREGCLDNEIKNIVGVKTFVRAKYDFGNRRRLEPGNVTDYRDGNVNSEDIVDMADINILNIFLYNLILDTYEDSIIISQATMDKIIAEQEAAANEQKDKDKEDVVKPDGDNTDNKGEADKPEDNTDGDNTDKPEQGDNIDKPEQGDNTDNTGEADKPEDNTDKDNTDKPEQGDNTEDNKDNNSESEGDTTNNKDDVLKPEDNTDNSGDTSNTDSNVTDSSDKTSSETESSADKSDTSNSTTEAAPSTETTYTVEAVVDSAKAADEITFGADPSDPCGAYVEMPNGARKVVWIKWEGGRVERDICDFDGDGYITTKDLLYAVMNEGYTPDVLDNINSSRKVELKKA